MVGQLDRYEVESVGDLLPVLQKAVGALSDADARTGSFRAEFPLHAWIETAFSPMPMKKQTLRVQTNKERWIL